MSPLTPEFVMGYRAMMLNGLTNEVEITKKVLGAIPDAKRDYKPDPQARTAWELAWHIANSDRQFLEGIADLNSTWAPRHRRTSRRRLPNWWNGMTETSSTA